MNKDSLGDRMKGYEEVSKTVLMKRTPVIIRLDGKAFHTFTRGFKKPFDTVLLNTMQKTAKYLCENIQGCVFGYTQSDEITLVLEDYHDINISPWFEYEVQKICSVSASMATLQFNKIFGNEVVEYMINSGYIYTDDEKEDALIDAYHRSMNKGAMFDARCFNVPVNDVTNCIIWRQQDATRNSIQMVARDYFSHKEVQGKNTNELQDMLIEQKNINWNDFPVYQKRGAAIIKDENNKWVIDRNMPIITADRDYVESLIIF